VPVGSVLSGGFCLAGAFPGGVRCTSAPRAFA